MLAICFVNKVLLGHNHRPCLDVVCGFLFTVAELSSDGTGWLQSLPHFPRALYRSPGQLLPEELPGRRETLWEFCAPFPICPHPQSGWYRGLLVFPLNGPRFCPLLSMLVPGSIFTSALTWTPTAPCPQAFLCFPLSLQSSFPPSPKPSLQSEDRIRPASCWTPQWLPVLRIVAPTKPAGALLPPPRASAQTASSARMSPILPLCQRQVLTLQVSP